MKNPETGEAQFCPGCPMAGTFCGDVTDETLLVRVNEDSAQIRALDQNGGASTTCEFATWMLPGISLITEQTDLYDKYKTAIMKRIGECSGPTTVNSVHSIKMSCRSLDSDVLMNMLVKQLKESDGEQ